MKIGIVYLNKGFTGGAEKRYYNLINGLTDHHEIYLLANRTMLNFWTNIGGFKNNITISCLEEDQPLNIEMPVSIKKSRIGFLKIIKRFLSNILWFLKMNVIVYNWDRKYNIKYINAVQAAGITTILTKIRGVKLVFTYTDYMVQNGFPFYFIKNQGLKTVAMFFDRFDFLSDMIPERMISKGLKLTKSRIRISNNSFIDLDKIKKSDKKSNIIAFSGRFEDIKNPILALKVAFLLQKSNFDFKLLMLGEGIMKPEILKYIHENDLANCVEIRYTNDIYSELKNTLIYLSLQKDNNFPSQALLEAMASGCIPIVTDVGETRKLINKTNGFLVNADEHEIFEIISRILSKKEDFIEISNCSAKTVEENYTLRNYLKYYENLFEFTNN